MNFLGKYIFSVFIATTYNYNFYTLNTNCLIISINETATRLFLTIQIRENFLDL